MRISDWSSDVCASYLGFRHTRPSWFVPLSCRAFSHSQPDARTMARKYFGTDGIRGLTNLSPMTAAMAMKVGMAAGAHFVRGSHKHRVVIGKDTRLSGYMLENARTEGRRGRGRVCQEG